MQFMLLIAAALFVLAGGNAAQAQSACGMQLGNPVVFCDTFDTQNAGTPSRAGALDPNVWGVSRAIGGGVNFGQQQYNQWNATTIQKCDGSTPTVVAPNDVIICNGQLREATNDNNSLQLDAGDITVLAMYPKQPFDFAGRTGTVSFDVSNDTHSSHAAWPEFWLSDLPVPAPFNHFDSWQTLPQHGLGIRFEAGAGPNNPGVCQNGNNMDKRRWTVGSAAVVRNYVLDDSNGYGPGIVHVQQIDCVIASSGPGDMNHIELRINQNQIDVWASDAGQTALRKIAVITNANLTLTRGLIWLEDVHYNADKGDPPSQRQHTFAWDNVAFDGPFTYRDFSYDALDNTLPGPNGSINIGKMSTPSLPASWDVLGLPANPTPAVVRVLFNFSTSFDPTPNNILVTVNGHPHPTPWPYPDQNATWRTLAVTVPVSDLVPGTNVVQIASDTGGMVSSNVNIVLVNVPGGVPVLPGSDNSYPSGAVSPVNGACGPANGTTVPTAPTTNLCSAGNASAVTGSGPWSWTCAGFNGGTTANCSANKTAAVNGSCGSANGGAFSSAPTSNLCAAGAVTGPWSWSRASGPAPLPSAGPWSWMCKGYNGGGNMNCSAAHF